MSYLIKPKNYKPLLDLKQTELGIKQIKEFFQLNLSSELRLRRAAAMDAVGEMLDEAEKLAEKAKAAIKAALADEDSRYHSVVTFFMEFHRDEVGPDIAAELFPGTDPAKLSFAEMVDFLKLKRFGSLVDSEMNQQVFILDLSFNPEITDELMVIYFDLNKEIFCITHES